MKLQPFASTLAVVPLLLCAPVAAIHAQDTGTGRVEARPADSGALRRELARRYPPHLERAAIGGAVRVRFHVDVEGRTDSVHVAFSSGVADLDHAAASIAAAARYHPAREDGTAVPSWASLELVFGDADFPPPPLPRLVDRGALQGRVQSHYPADLRSRQVETSAVLQLTIDASGTVTRAAAPVAGCFPTAAAAAAEAATHFRFEPLPDGATAPREVLASLTFTHDSVLVTFVGDSSRVQRRPPGEEADTPPGSGANRPPQLQNAQSVQAALQRRAEAFQRSGLRGQVMVLLWVDDRGRVTRRRVGGSSGECDLDLAALDVTRLMRFSAARKGGERIGVWVEMPISFGVR